MKTKIIKNKKGFTLVELIIYVAILSMFIFSIVAFLNVMTNSRINNQIVLEVNNQGDQVIKTITQSIRNATLINSPSASSMNTSLSLETSIPGTNPTVFSISGGVLYMTEGSGSAVALTNNKVVIGNLEFSNLSQPSTSGTIKVRFTLTSAVASPNNITNKSVDFYGSATIR